MKKQTLAFASLAALVIGLAISGPVKQYVFPTTAVVLASTLDMYLDNKLFLNGSDIEWGVTYPGYIHYANLTVVNTGESNCTVYMASDLAESGWTYTWTANDTLLEPNEVAEGDLELYVPETAVPGSYSWTTYVLAEQT